MAIIIQARNGTTNATLTQEDLRRQITVLHLKFYGALVMAIVSFWYAGQSNRSFFILILYSFWVPQIILNIVTESRKPLHPYFMFGMSLTRSFAPIYVFAVRNNFLREVNPDFPLEPRMCQMLILWIGELKNVFLLFASFKHCSRKLHLSPHPYHRHPDCRSLWTRKIWHSVYDPAKVWQCKDSEQLALLYCRLNFRRTFLSRFLPPKFDYSRPIPPSLLPRLTNNTSSAVTSEIELAPLLNGETSPAHERNTGVARNRRGGANRSRLGSRADDTPAPSMSEDTGATQTLDCVICYNDIDISDRNGYMLAPCDHIFHRNCLVQWMEVKMECPICRCNLPSI